MPVDFSSLVLAPAMDTFGRTFTIDPISSRPGKPPYEMRGIYSSVPYDVLALEGPLSDQKTTIGIRVADFDGPIPKRDDVITIGQNPRANEVGLRYRISDTHLDGQGGATLTLQKIEPDYPR